MKIKIIKYDGIELICDALSFEFRTNHVANWIKIKLDNDETVTVNDVCVIKTDD